MNGAIVLLESEYPHGKRKKAFDATIDGTPAEIKTIERNGRWAIRTKIHSAICQGAELLVLYFPDSTMFSEERIREGWEMNRVPNQPSILKQILAVRNGRVIEIAKPPG